MDKHEFVLYLRHFCVRSIFFRSESIPHGDSNSLLYGFQGQQTWKVMDIIMQFLKDNPSPKVPSDVSFQALERDHFFFWDSTNFRISQVFVIFSRTGYSTYMAKGEVTLDGSDITAFLEIRFNPIAEKLFLIRLKDERGTMIAEQEFDS